MFRQGSTAVGWTLAVTLLLNFPSARGQHQVWSDQEKPIVEQLQGLRGISDDVRARTTLHLAIEIRRLPTKPSKLRLAENLAALSTEGDFGHDTLQEVATTLAGAIRENPLAAAKDQAFMPYAELAQLVRYEHVQADLEDPQFKAALAQLEADDARRQKADFTLTDLQGKAWTLKRLTGKVVLVNFWATWCPPCRKEMPDLQALHEQFRDQLVVLAISDEEAAKVEPFIAGRNVTYPILLDPGRKVNELFGVQGIPRSFVYDREEKLVAQAIDMRTRRQFLEMLEQAGLH
jgi:thiol-disulfide isomerase/thioredoxin